MLKFLCIALGSSGIQIICSHTAPVTSSSLEYKADIVCFGCYGGQVSRLIFSSIKWSISSELYWKDSKKWQLLPPIRAETGRLWLGTATEDMNQLISLLAAKSRDSSRSVKRDEPTDQHLNKPVEVECNLKTGQVDGLDYTRGLPLLIRAVVCSVWTLKRSSWAPTTVRKPTVECWC